MTNSESLTLNQGNDEDLLILVRTNVPVANTPLDLTGCTVEVLLKLSPDTADSDASTWTGSSAGIGVQITDAIHGVVSVSIPAGNINPAYRWWRCDVISTGKRKTAVYGIVSVTAT